MEHAADGKSPEATWNTRRLPTRLEPGWGNRLFVAAGGFWRGYFPLSGEVLCLPAARRRRQGTRRTRVRRTRSSSTRGDGQRSCRWWRLGFEGGGTGRRRGRWRRGSAGPRGKKIDRRQGNDEGKVRGKKIQRETTDGEGELPGLARIQREGPLSAGKKIEQETGRRRRRERSRTKPRRKIPNSP